MSAHAAGRLRDGLNWLIDDEMFADLQVHGNRRWPLRLLAVTAVIWAVSGESGLVERFHQALVVVSAWGSKGLGALTYQGFAKALVRWTEVLRPRLLTRLRQRLQTVVHAIGDDTAGSCWRWTARGSPPRGRSLAARNMTVSTRNGELC